MKSEKVWTSLLLTSSLLLFTSAAQAGSVEFYDYDASTGTFTNAVRACTLVTDETRKLTTGWYIVNYDVTIPEGNRLVVEGDVHLVLGATLKIEKPGEGQAAVRTTDATLTIYRAKDGEGALVAAGGPVNVYSQGGTGIGGDADCAGGIVTINGGSVTATGGVSAAGIGGGFDGDGGTVTINGGTVSAEGGATGRGHRRRLQWRRHGDDQRRYRDGDGRLPRCGHRHRRRVSPGDLLGDDFRRCDSCE